MFILWFLAATIIGLSNVANAQPFAQPFEVWYSEFGSLVHDEYCSNSVMLQGPHRIIIVGERLDGNEGFFVVTRSNGTAINDPILTVNGGDTHILAASWSGGQQFPGYLLTGTTVNALNQSMFWAALYDDLNNMREGWPYVDDDEDQTPITHMGAGFRPVNTTPITYMFDIGGIDAASVPSINELSYDGNTSNVTNLDPLWTVNRVRPGVSENWSPLRFLYAGLGTDEVTGYSLRVALMDFTLQAPLWEYQYQGTLPSYASDANYDNINQSGYAVIGGAGTEEDIHLLVTLLDEDGQSVYSQPVIYENQPELDSRAAVIADGYTSEASPFLVAAFDLPDETEAGYGAVRVLLLQASDGAIVYQYDIVKPWKILTPKFIHILPNSPNSQTLKISVGGDLKDLVNNQHDFWINKIDFDLTTIPYVGENPFFGPDGPDEGDEPDPTACNPCGLVVKGDGRFDPGFVELWWNPACMATTYQIWASDDSELAPELWELIATVDGSETYYVDEDWDPDDSAGKIRFYTVRATLDYLNSQGEIDQFYSDSTNMCGAFEFVAHGNSPLVAYVTPFGLPFKFWPLDENGVPIYGGNEDGEPYESFKPSDIIGQQINAGTSDTADKIVAQVGGHSARIDGTTGMWTGNLESLHEMIPGNAYWFINKSGGDERIILAGQIDNIGFYNSKLITAPTGNPGYYATPISFRDARSRSVDALGLQNLCDWFIGGNDDTSDKIVAQVGGTHALYRGGYPCCAGNGVWWGDLTHIMPGKAYWIVNSTVGHSWNYAYPPWPFEICETPEP